MLTFLRGQVSDRKLRLFAVACWRHLWEQLPKAEKVYQDAVDLLEQFVDGHASREALDTNYDNAVIRGGGDYNIALLAGAIAPDAADAALATSIDAASIAKNDDETAVQAELLRHIIGNPFRRYAALNPWPSAVIQLAESLYNGGDCCFALHDALLEAGHAELAEHFEKEQWHPKGCWVPDLILGKQ
jgi:hypothetical protein